MTDTALIACTLKQINTANAAFEASGDQHARRQLLGLAKRLVSQLQSPEEMMLQLTSSQPILTACIDTCTQLGIFAALSAAQGEFVPVSCLVKGSTVSEQHLWRILRHLAASNIVRESSIGGAYASTPISDYFMLPGCESAFFRLRETLVPTLLKLPSWIAGKDGDYKTPFNAAFETHAPVYQWIHERPKHCAMFNTYMAMSHTSADLWNDLPPGTLEVDEKAKIDGAAVVVDVGGGKGHDLRALKAACPEIGKLVLQDLPKILEEAPETAGIEKMGHDYFKPQPVHGARVYFLRHVLHNRSDDDCDRILSNIVPAMRVGYSKVVIGDYVVPQAGADIRTTTFDMIMMLNFNTRERTEVEWEALLSKAGMIIERILTIDRSSNFIVLSLA